MNPLQAVMDPWTAVPLQGGSHVLFGYAELHPATGGMSWVRSSAIVELHRGPGTAMTESGGHYSLGRRFRPGNVAAEGEEAWLAFLMLVGRSYTGHTSVPGTRETDARWIAACKMARHLGVVAPARHPASVGPFMVRHRDGTPSTSGRTVRT